MCSNDEGAPLEDHLRGLHAWGPPLQAVLTVASRFPSLQSLHAFDPSSALPNTGWLPVVLYLRVLQVKGPQLFIGALACG